jgi:hypothetical protein
VDPEPGEHAGGAGDKALAAVLLPVLDDLLGLAAEQGLSVYVAGFGLAGASPESACGSPAGRLEVLGRGAGGAGYCVRLAAG